MSKSTKTASQKTVAKKTVAKKTVAKKTVAKKKSLRGSRNPKTNAVIGNYVAKIKADVTAKKPTKATTKARSGKVTSFDDIPMLVGATYSGSRDTETVTLNRVHAYVDGDDFHHIDLDPDYQRGRVWDTDQQRKYVEYVLRGGRESCNFIFNRSTITIKGVLKAHYVSIDGKQRLLALHAFMSDKLEVFGGLTCSEMARKSEHGKFPWGRYHISITCVQMSRADVLRFYLELNSNGTPHSDTEIERVRGLLKSEAKK